MYRVMIASGDLRHRKRECSQADCNDAYPEEAADIQRSMFAGISYREKLMALFKNTYYVWHVQGEAFDHVYAPGELAPYSGIYRCEGCGCEHVLVEQQPLPLNEHHTHIPVQGGVAWQLVVAASGDWHRVSGTG